jgi:hypothetical protein
VTRSSLLRCARHRPGGIGCSQRVST